MAKRKSDSKKKKGLIVSLFIFTTVLLKNKLFIGFLIGLIFVFFANKAVHYSSTDQFCESCHVHPHSTISWKQSSHYDNKSGYIVHCVDCHLPPEGLPYLTEKARTGLRDVYSKYFKDVSKINWENKSKLEHAVKITYKESCTHCHQNLFPLGLTKKGEDAHLYYSQKEEQLRCINCHLHVGHYSEKAEQEIQFGKVEKKEMVYFSKPARVDNFENFTEQVPKSSTSFDMIAIPGGQFTLGSQESEPYRKADEGPASTVTVSSFWMGKTEVSWDEFETFYYQTKTEGRTDTRALKITTVSKIDAITGPTPPYGLPDQGWGKGSRPAITMTYHAAETYCQWLSKVTGKKYRLPTEAEWEYACKANQEGSYFFDGNPKNFTRQRWINRIMGVDTTTINSYVIYAENSQGKTQEPSFVHENPFGLLNMSGNVREFCSDWYAPDAYSQYKTAGNIIDPKGPASGTEHVVRGGSYKYDAADVRSSSRDYTQHDAWMMTDPQMPKSLWWYSDCNDVGFRVVCEYNSK